MSEIAPLISDLAVILIAAGIITLIFKCLKQPVVLGYIVAGILAGPAVPYIPTVSDPNQYKNMGRHRRYISFICHGVRILFQEVDDCRRHSRYCIYNHSLRNDVSRLYCRKRAWLLASKQYIFRRYAFYVIHGYLSLRTTFISGSILPIICTRL